jgi:Xaa-Pro aminopeptidase
MSAVVDRGLGVEVNNTAQVNITLTQRGDCFEVLALDPSENDSHCFATYLEARKFAADVWLSRCAHTLQDEVALARSEAERAEIRRIFQIAGTVVY